MVLCRVATSFFCHVIPNAARAHNCFLITRFANCATLEYNWAKCLLRGKTFLLAEYTEKVVPATVVKQKRAAFLAIIREKQRAALPEFGNYPELS